MPNTREILKKVRQVEIRTRRQVSDAMAGAYRSVFKGQGMDFEEVREYQPGDDVRSIDWNVTAKQGKPFIKRYKEERELTIFIVVDLSGSTDFGSVSQSKRELAGELASVLAFSATRNNDKIGLLLFTETVEKYVPAEKGRRHVLRVIRDILFHEPKGRGTDIAGALRFLNRIQRRRAIVFLLSDFLTSSNTAWIRPDTGNQAPYERLLRLTRQRHDLICVSLSDPREEELPDVGVVTLEDAETGELLEIDTSNRKLRRTYRMVNERRREELARNLRQYGIDHLALSTAEPYITALRAFFKKREGRR